MPRVHEFSLKASLELLKANGCQPKTLFDIGVATGTTGFYGVFPDVRYLLVDPLVEAEPFMREICDRYPGVYEVAAAGAASGEATFNVDPGLSGSSFFRKDGQPRTVSVVTLDELVEKHRLEPPFVVKLDVQGFEAEVLHGFERGLANTEAVISEASFWGDRKGGGRAVFHDLVAFMADHGFVVYDVAGLVRRPRDGALAEADFVFVRREGHLRRHAGYHAPEHYHERQAAKAAKFAAGKART
jgi:FkbM family methyltransferase